VVEVADVCPLLDVDKDDFFFLPCFDDERVGSCLLDDTFSFCLVLEERAGGMSGVVGIKECE